VGGIPSSPVTSTIIEGRNCYLEARLKKTLFVPIHIAHAKLWMNGYVLKREYKMYTHCRGKFPSTNGKSGVELTKKQNVYFSAIILIGRCCF